MMNIRTLLYVFTVAAIVLAGCGKSSPDSKNDPLRFYLVNEEKIDGGRFIDQPGFEKVGYVANTPDLVITQLEAVKTTFHKVPLRTTWADGREIPGPKVMVEFRHLGVVMLPDDGKN
jgi:hypothetical protein